MGLFTYIELDAKLKISVIKKVVHYEKLAY